MTKRILTVVRTILFYCFFIGTIPVIALLMQIIPRLIKKTNPWAVCIEWGKLVNIFLDKVCGVKILVHGPLPANDSPAIVICNHTGPWETIGFMPIYPVNLTYVVKKELVSWKYSLFGFGLKALNPIPISREPNAGDFNLIKELSAEHFKQKRHVLIFPGGTRKVLSESIHFPPSGVLLAKKLKCRIIPVFIDSERWARGRLIKDYGMIHPGNITIVFGEPVSSEQIAGTPVREVHEKLLGFYKKELETLNGRLDSSL